jgi:hypothetical protein
MIREQRLQLAALFRDSLDFVSTYETLTICTALLAVVIAAVSLWRTSRTNKEQIALQRIMATLAQKQLDQIQHEETSQASARLAFRIERSGKHGRKFVVENVGESPAERVSFELIPQGTSESPLVQRDYDQKFPIPILAPGSSVSALAAFHLGSATSLKVILNWQETDGRERREETYVSL